MDKGVFPDSPNALAKFPLLGDKLVAYTFDQIGDVPALRHVPIFVLLFE